MMTRGSVQYSWCEPASSLTQSASGSQNGPASSPTTAPPVPGQALQQRAAAGAAPHDDQVDLVVVVVAAHVGAKPVVGAIVAVGHQPGRFVRARMSRR